MCSEFADGAIGDVALSSTLKTIAIPSNSFCCYIVVLSCPRRKQESEFADFQLKQKLFWEISSNNTNCLT